jgi:hypothetical protein
MTNPNPLRISDAIWHLWTGFKQHEPAAKLGGVYADKPGYHNFRNALPSTDYSVEDVAADRRGPAALANGLDITLPSDKMPLYTNRLDKAARARDPRLYTSRGPVLREFIGTKDNKIVYCYVLVGGVPLGVGTDAGPDPGRSKTHLWHIHLSIIRQFGNDMPALDGVLSVLTGESLAAWRARTEDDMSAADVQAIRGDLGRLAQILMTGRQNALFNTVNHSWLDNPGSYDLNRVNAESKLRDIAILAAVQGLDTNAVLTKVDERARELATAIGQVDENVVAALPGRTDGDLVQLLNELLGEDRAEHIARLILGEQPA